MHLCLTSIPPKLIYFLVILTHHLIMPWCGVLLWQNFKWCGIGFVDSMQVARKEMSHDWKVEKLVKHWQSCCLADQVPTNLEALREIVGILVTVGFYLYYVCFQQWYSSGIEQPGLGTLSFLCHQFKNVII